MIFFVHRFLRKLFQLYLNLVDFVLNMKGMYERCGNIVRAKMKFLFLVKHLIIYEHIELNLNNENEIRRHYLEF